MSQDSERDYVLGTNDEEIQRLGLQHRIWRSTVLDCWNRAGITMGSRVLDVGAGPGYATIDLAEIVGASGQVIAVERSSRFVQAARSICRSRRMDHVQFHELDLMMDPIPAKNMDAVWCRWVTSFVSSPSTLISKIAATVKPGGGGATFHEYIDYFPRVVSCQRAKILKNDNPNLNAFQFENALPRDEAIGLRMPLLMIFRLENRPAHGAVHAVDGPRAPPHLTVPAARVGRGPRIFPSSEHNRRPVRKLAAENSRRLRIR